MPRATRYLHCPLDAPSSPAMSAFLTDENARRCGFPSMRRPADHLRHRSPSFRFGEGRMTRLARGHESRRARAWHLLAMDGVTHVALTRASIISPILGFLESIGASIDRLLAAAELPSWITSDGEALIPATSTVRLFGPAVRETGIPNLGLRAAERNGVGSLGVFGRLVSSAPTLGDALERVVRYNRTMTSNRPLWLRPRGDRIEFCMTVAARFDPQDVGWQQDDHYCLGLMLSVVRMAAGRHWRPPEVHFETGEAAGLRDADTLSDARIAFRQPVTMLALPRDLLATPLSPVRDGAAAAERHRRLAILGTGPGFCGIGPASGRDAVLRRRLPDGRANRRVPRDERPYAAAPSGRARHQPRRARCTDAIRDRCGRAAADGRQDPRSGARPRLLGPRQFHACLPAMDGMLAATIPSAIRRKASPARHSCPAGRSRDPEHAPAARERGRNVAARP